VNIVHIIVKWKYGLLQMRSLATLE